MGDSCNWLKDIFLANVPNARIMLFGYNSVVGRSKSISDINSFSEQLLQLVLKRRSDAQGCRPLVIVCHSLDGIIVKKRGGTLILTIRPTAIHNYNVTDNSLRI